MSSIRLGASVIVMSFAVACGDSNSDGGGPGGGGSGGTGKGGSGTGAKGGSGGAIGGSGGATGGAGGSIAGAGGSLGGSSGQAGSGGIGGATDAGTDGPSPECEAVANKTLDQLTTEEIKLICDCVAEIYGGYGTVISCDGGATIKAKASQQECVDSYTPFTCATVGDALKCAKDLHACDQQSAVCTKYLKCALSDGGGA